LQAILKNSSRKKPIAGYRQDHQGKLFSTPSDIGEEQQDFATCSASMEENQITPDLPG